MNVTQFQDIFSEEVWTTTYKNHKDNNINDTFRRIAKAIASVENTEELKQEWEEKFYDLLTDFKGVTGGRIMSNAGTEWHGTTLMNCFVGPRDSYDIDSLEGIYSHLLSQSQTLKSEGGWGENFSYIRPRGAFIHGIGVETPGAVKYMELFDKASEIITSGSGKKSSNKKAKGKIRKGAMMAVLDVWHPDIVEFITAKQQSGRLNKFNMSVNLTDEFMNRLIGIEKLENFANENIPGYDEYAKDEIDEKIKQLDTWNLIFPDTKFEKYKEEWDGNITAWKNKGYPVKTYNTVSVKWLWNLIMESTYNKAEPGVLFLDRANYFNPLYYKETIFSTNPCVTGDGVVEIQLNGKIEKMTVKDAVDLFNLGTTFKIKSFNIETKQIEWKLVTFADMTRKNAKVLKIIDSVTGKSIKVTEDHKVYTKNRGYVMAKDLTSDDVLEIS